VCSILGKTTQHRGEDPEDVTSSEESPLHGVKRRERKKRVAKQYCRGKIRKKGDSWGKKERLFFLPRERHPVGEKGRMCKPNSGRVGGKLEGGGRNI